MIKKELTMTHSKTFSCKRQMDLFLEDPSVVAQTAVRKFDRTGFIWILTYTKG